MGPRDVGKQWSQIVIPALDHRRANLLRDTTAVDQQHRVAILENLLLGAIGEGAGGDIGADPAAAETCDGAGDVEAIRRGAMSLALRLPEDDDSTRPNPSPASRRPMKSKPPSADARVTPKWR
jgi:hypothetical protein